MKIINLTPHELNFVTPEGEIKVPPSGVVARVSVTREKIGEIVLEGKTLPVYKSTFGNVEGLPDPEPDTIFVVSSIVAQAVPERSDIFIPDDSVRDENGRIIGARALAKV